MKVLAVTLNAGNSPSPQPSPPGRGRMVGSPVARGCSLRGSGGVCAGMVAMALAFSLETQPLLACDLCAVYAATEAQGGGGKGFFGGVAEQFTHLGTLQEDGQRVENTVGQVIDSSVSQIFAGYNFSDRFGVQLNLPVIYR